MSEKDNDINSLTTLDNISIMFSCRYVLIGGLAMVLFVKRKGKIIWKLSYMEGI